MNKQQIGEAITKERTVKGITQVQLAEKLNVRRQAIIEVELSQFDYRIGRLLEILDGLDLQLLIVRKDANVATMVSAPVEAGTEVLIFRGVKPLLEDPDNKPVPKKTKKR
jgi:transcriptional regulator with XRE-family HTH domain